MSNYIDNIVKNAVTYDLVSKPLANDMANEFSIQSTYAVGDYVMHDYKLYKCISAVTTAGNWNSAKWQECKISDEINGGVKFTAQTLTSEQKAQARNNIGGASQADLEALNAVRYDQAQTLTTAQKTQARANIGAVSQEEATPDAIRYSAQSLTEAQKNQARVNVGTVASTSIAEEFSTSKAYAVGDLVVYDSKLYKFKTAHSAGAWNNAQVDAVSVKEEISSLKGDLSDIVDNSVRFDIAQNKTKEEKARARENIGLTSDNESMQYINDLLAYNEEIDPNNHQYTVKFAITSAGVAYSNGVNYYPAIIQVPIDASKIKVQANENYESIIAFLKNTNIVMDSYAPFSNKYSARIVLSPNEEGEYDVVDGDTSYMYVLLKNASGLDYSPKTVSFIGDISKDDMYEGSLLRKIIDTEIEESGNTDVVNPDNYIFDRKTIIGANGKVSDLTGMEQYSAILNPYIIPIPNTCKAINIESNSENGSIYAILSSNVLVDTQNAPFSSEYQSRIVTTAGDINKYRTGIDTLYLYVYRTGQDGKNYSPNSIVFKISPGGSSYDDTELRNVILEIRKALFNNYPISVNSTHRDIPQTRAAYLGYKRYQQLSELEWTAKKLIPNRLDYDIPAGDKVGVPYSSVKEYNKYIGYNVSIKTFMTAANNPYSLLYTENTYGDESQSAYGITYHGVNCGPYFGAVCNTFALYMAGMPIDYNTNEFAYLCDIGVFEKIYDQSAYGLKLCDIIWESGHGSCVVDIYRDERGNPTRIMWAEQVMFFPVVNEHTPESFNAELARRNAIIYRVTDLYKNLYYEPSEFVATEGEEAPTPYVYNDDICTYAGDYAAFYAGEAVYINYEKGSYVYMELYKGTTRIANITLPDSYNATHSVNVTSNLTGYGKYSARLSDGNGGYSAYIYFEVIETNVTAALNGTDLTVSFSSHNGTPQYVQITDRAGRSRGIRALTEAEVSSGTITYNPYSLATAQSYELTGTLYVKVFFKGDYGTVRNDWLSIAF